MDDPASATSWSGFSSLPDGYRAVVLGASGGIGSAFCRLLNDDPRLSELLAFSRRDDGFDITDEASVERAAAAVAAKPIHLLLCATGVLSAGEAGPEKTLRQISPDVMLETFRINAVGPAIVAKHFLPLLDRRSRSLAAILSARVGSIGDNRLGGWISYRSSKAALNQIVRTASIELSRTHADNVIVAMHPGTVATSFSSRYSKNHDVTEPDTAAASMLQMLDGLDRSQTGSFLAYDGSEIVW
jgi:NAD(P)-dependent dehydrogenase (short-subunit alcohol dehydrogenase family)